MRERPVLVASIGGLIEAPSDVVWRTARNDGTVLVRPVEADLVVLLDATRSALAECRAEEPVLADAVRFWSTFERLLSEARLSALIRTSESGLVMEASASEESS